MSGPAMPENYGGNGRKGIMSSRGGRYTAKAENGLRPRLNENKRAAGVKELLGFFKREREMDRARQQP